MAITIIEPGIRLGLKECEALRQLLHSNMTLAQFVEARKTLIAHSPNGRDDMAQAEMDNVLAISQALHTLHHETLAR